MRAWWLANANANANGNANANMNLSMKPEELNQATCSQLSSINNNQYYPTLLRTRFPAGPVSPLVDLLLYGLGTESSDLKVHAAGLQGGNGPISHTEPPGPVHLNQNRNLDALRLKLQNINSFIFR